MKKNYILIFIYWNLFNYSFYNVTVVNLINGRVPGSVLALKSATPNKSSASSKTGECKEMD